MCLQINSVLIFIIVISSNGISISPNGKSSKELCQRTKTLGISLSVITLTFIMVIKLVIISKMVPLQAILSKNCRKNNEPNKREKSGKIPTNH